MAYSYAQMQSILRQAGWPENLLVTMAAIGQAESSGIPTAHNPKPPDDSYGLWQINMIGNLGPQRRARYGLSSNNDLYDPLVNARIALDVYNQQGLNAWGPYVTGLYKKYLPASQLAYSGAGNAPAPVNVASSPNSDPFSQTDYTGEGGLTGTQIALLAAAGVALYLVLK